MVNNRNPGQADAGVPDVRVPEESKMLGGSSKVEKFEGDGIVGEVPTLDLCITQL